MGRRGPHIILAANEGSQADSASPQRPCGSRSVPRPVPTLACAATGWPEVFPAIATLRAFVLALIRVPLAGSLNSAALSG